MSEKNGKDNYNSSCIITCERFYVPPYDFAMMVLKEINAISD